MKLLLDATVLIDVLRGDSPAVRFLEDAVESEKELWSISVVRTEVLTGMRRREETATQRLLNVVEWLPVDIGMADAAGQLARTWIKSHPGVDTVDYLLAAAAQQLKARLCTSNIRHFPMIKGLTAPYR